MKMLIPTESVVLHTLTESTEDDFGRTAYTETDVDVNGVIVGSPESSDVESAIEVYGKRIAYVIGIPKGDTNTWEDCDVTIRGRKFHTIGIPVQYTAGAMPDWWPCDKKIGVEAYE